MAPFTSLSLLLAISAVAIQAYDCNLSSNSCSIGTSSSLTSYSICMVRKWSVSAFIQCASQPSVPDLVATTSSGQASYIPVLSALTEALNGSPDCSSCNITQKIIEAAKERPGPEFGSHLCEKYHPMDHGLCCLRNCLMGGPREHSLSAFCDGNGADLMNEPLQPESCGRPADVTDAGVDGGSSGSGGGAGAAYSTGSGGIYLIPTKAVAVSTTVSSVPASTTDARSTTVSTAGKSTTSTGQVTTSVSSGSPTQPPATGSSSPTSMAGRGINSMSRRAWGLALLLVLVASS